MKVVVVKVDKVNNCTDNLEISALKPTRRVLSSTFQEDFCCDLLDIIMERVPVLIAISLYSRLKEGFIKSNMPSRPSTRVDRLQ